MITAPGDRGHRTRLTARSDFFILKAHAGHLAWAFSICTFCPKETNMERLRNGIAAMIVVWLLFLPRFAGAEAREVVLFDEAHNQKFLVGQSGPLDLSGLAALFQGEGLTVKVNKRMITAEVLSNVDA